MISDEDLQELKRLSADVKEFSEHARAAKLARNNLLEAHPDLQDGYTVGSFTVGQLIAELQKYPEDMPVFGWVERDGFDVEPAEMPTPRIALRVDEVAPVHNGEFWVEADLYLDGVDDEEERAEVQAATVKALLISGIEHGSGS